MLLKKYLTMLSVILILAGCGSGNNKPSADNPSVPPTPISLNLDSGLPIINLLNSSNYFVSGNCDNDDDILIEFSTPLANATAVCSSGRFSTFIDLSDLISVNPTVTLTQGENIITVDTNLIPLNDQIPIPSSPVVEDVLTSPSANNVNINFNCEEIGQKIIFSGNGIQNNPLLFQCNSIGTESINMIFHDNFESNTNLITISGFDNNGNPNTVNTSFNLPIDTKAPTFSVQSTGSLIQGEDLEIIIEFSDLNLPSSFNYSVILSGAINETVTCISNPCLISKPQTQAEGQLTLAISSNAVSDIANNSSPISSTQFNFNIISAPDNVIELTLTDAINVELGIETSNGKSWDIDWGDTILSTNNISGDTKVSHTYLTPFSGIIKIHIPWDSDITGIFATNLGLDIGASELPPNLVKLYIDGQNSVTSNLSELPRGLEYVYVNGQNTLFGNLSGLPTQLKELSIEGNNYISGNISNIPLSLIKLNITGHNTISGNISSLSMNLRDFKLLGNNTISGDISDISSNLTKFYVEGDNTLSGDISNIPFSINEFKVTGNNTIIGNISNLKSNLTVFYIHGNGTIEGNINSTPRNLTVFYSWSQGTIGGTVSGVPANIKELGLRDTSITGQISELPSTLEKIRLTGTTSIVGTYADLPEHLISVDLALTAITGDLDSLPPNLQYFRGINYGDTIINPATLPRSLKHLYSYTAGNIGIVNGDLSGFPEQLEFLFLGGDTSFGGDIANLPNTLKSLSLTGTNNTVTGDISTLPPELELFEVGGNNTTYGDFTQIPNSITNLYIAGASQITVNSINWNRTNMNFSRLIFVPERGPSKTGLTQTEVDRVLIMMSEITNWSQPGTINLAFKNAAPSTTGNNAKNLILSNGATSVNTNY